VVTRKLEGGKPARIQLKFASRAATAQALRVQVSGAGRLASTGTLTVITSPDPDAGNSLDEPLRITPKSQPFKGIAREFTLNVPAYSVGVLEFDAR
jgi:alpha-N-arabinofuranosidase